MKRIVLILTAAMMCSMVKAQCAMDSAQCKMHHAQCKMDSAQCKKERKKVGVVLSGGGAKGMAHIGVLKVL